MWASALLLALVIDRWLGEPPVFLHPVVWMGTALGWLGKRIAPPEPRARDHAAFWQGALCWCALACIVVALASALQALVFHWLPDWLAVIALALLLKPMLAWQMLRAEVFAVERALSQSLHAGQTQLSRLVSRDTALLNEVQVRESAIETLAENLNDSVVAPIFWFVIAGLPGAALYRFANTADAMWGYPEMRNGRYWQWAGKWAARADDVLSWVPARLTALALWLVVRGVRWFAIWREASHTPSPNSGWPMAAMALSLNVKLSKPDVYMLNAGGLSPVSGDVARAAALAWRVVLVTVLVAATVLLALHGSWMRGL